ncbi:hypothetical protein [Magnetospira sp. QH-2]|uniref:hypothetical protein n=1 Tax=Magnetospira sp. (strain QH-2) TaxID=1288970 RepID=UPI0003E80E2D|nr:hypothetical protein [Magnetospira sp. QH-2]CCQ74494.1 protein of unknown function [Magnetospira sp. QH-2]
MDDDIEEDKEPIYSEADFRKMAEMLGVLEIPEAIRADMDFDASFFAKSLKYDYEGSEPDLGKLTPGVTRKSLEKIKHHADGLIQALVGPGLPFDEDREFYRPILTDELIELSRHAEEAQKQAPKGGPQKKVARLFYIGLLAKTFNRLTGERPTRVHDPILGEDKGPFLMFVRAALEPISPKSLKGVEHDVRKVIAELKKAG